MSATSGIMGAVRRLSIYQPPSPSTDPSRPLYSSLRHSSAPLINAPLQMNALTIAQMLQSYFKEREEREKKENPTPAPCRQQPLPDDLLGRDHHDSPCEQQPLPQNPLRKHYQHSPYGQRVLPKDYEQQPLPKNPLRKRQHLLPEDPLRKDYENYQDLLNFSFPPKEEQLPGETQSDKDMLSSYWEKIADTNPGFSTKSRSFSEKEIELIILARWEEYARAWFEELEEVSPQNLEALFKRKENLFKKAVISYKTGITMTRFQKLQKETHLDLLELYEEKSEFYQNSVTAINPPS